MDKIVNGVVVALTQQEIDDINTHRLLVEAEQAATGYAIQRQREYPPHTDYLDAIVKDDDTALAKYKEDCLAVKAKYPKPQ